MSTHTPPENALLFTAYDVECALYLNRIFDGQYGLKCVYKKHDEWFWIAEPTLFEENLTSKDKTDEAYQLAIDEINIAMAKLFGEEPTEPQLGIERIQWLIDNKTEVEEDNLIVKK